jgi:hypothetical protein
MLIVGNFRLYDAVVIDLAQAADGGIYPCLEAEPAVFTD